MLVGKIRDDEWCEEQGSLMRGFAYGILDPQGERYQLALAHTRSRKSSSARKRLWKANLALSAV
jgi:predicted metal-dependent hydrolase